MINLEYDLECETNKAKKEILEDFDKYMGFLTDYLPRRLKEEEREEEFAEILDNFKNTLRQLKSNDEKNKRSAIKYV